MLELHWSWSSEVNPFHTFDCIGDRVMILCQQKMQNNKPCRMRIVTSKSEKMDFRSISFVLILINKSFEIEINNRNMISVLVNNNNILSDQPIAHVKAPLYHLRFTLRISHRNKWKFCTKFISTCLLSIKSTHNDFLFHSNLLMKSAFFWNWKQWDRLSGRLKLSSSLYTYSYWWKCKNIKTFMPSTNWSLQYFFPRDTYCDLFSEIYLQSRIIKIFLTWNLFENGFFV